MDNGRTFPFENRQRLPSSLALALSFANSPRNQLSLNPLPSSSQRFKREEQAFSLALLALLSLSSSSPSPSLPMPPSFPSSTFTSRRYALVIDAGSSGSRMQIYSWKDPKAEREEVRAGTSDIKGKGREGAGEDLSSLRRLPRVERGVKEGTGEWQKKVEPGESMPAARPSNGEDGGKRRSKLGTSP